MIETMGDTVPAVECATWCEDGTSHTGAAHPDDRRCSAGYLDMQLSREQPRQFGGLGQLVPSTVTASLQRDPSPTRSCRSVGTAR